MTEDTLHNIINYVVADYVLKKNEKQLGGEDIIQTAPPPLIWSSKNGGRWMGGGWEEGDKIVNKFLLHASSA